VSQVEQSPQAGDGHDGAPERAGSHARATGGIMGVIAAEARMGSARPTPPASRPVSAALVELAQAFASRQGQGTPLDVAEQLTGLGSPAWLLSVAIARPRSATISADALRLAHAAGVPGHALPHCVGYVELGAALFGGRDAGAAIELITGQPVSGGVHTALTLCGEPHLDALTTGMWALQQLGSFAEVVTTLASLAPPGVAAAAGGLLGLRDGAGAVPGPWQDALPTAACASLAQALVQVRHDAFMTPTPRTRPRSGTLSGPGRIAAGTSGTGATWGWTRRA
jgi:hypothetical protein